jgi:hypothetical protein
MRAFLPEDDRLKANLLTSLNDRFWPLADVSVTLAKITDKLQYQSAGKQEETRYVRARLVLHGRDDLRNLAEAPQIKQQPADPLVYRNGRHRDVQGADDFEKQA